MAKQKDDNIFQPRARLLLQLGDQLIKNESIALLELVKNSYDADSNNVIVSLENIDKPKAGKIIVEDDGEGMNYKIIKDAWMEPGSDYKELIFSAGKRSKKYDRLPIGEKGIGRFGVHKLGFKIELITRRKNEKEIKLLIDWREFQKSKYLKDANIEIAERNPVYFKGNKTGTRIVISDLRTEWDRRMLRSIYKSLLNLCSPFDKLDSFKIDFRTDKREWLQGLPNFKDILEYSLFYFKCSIKGNEIIEFQYEFTPWNNMEGLEPTVVKYFKDQPRKNKNAEFISDNSQILGKDPETKKEVEIDLSRHGIGEVHFEGYIFDLDNKILSFGLDTPQTLKSYLAENGGIRIYRDKIRINEYGDQGNDWLNLDIRRVNIPTKKISNNIILAQISLDREASSGLIEKTNREGFVENDSYKAFVSAILFTIDKIETYRSIDKTALREKYSPTDQSEPVLADLGELRALVNKRIDQPKLKNEIIGYVDRIQEEYQYIQEVLLGSDGSGLSLSIVIHEIEKIIIELNHLVKKEKAPSTVLNLVQHLSKLVEGYTDLIKKSEKKEQDVKKLISGSLFNVNYRLLNHDIKLVKKFESYKGTPAVNCSKKLILGSLLNIIDNSIYWLDKKETTLKKVNKDFTKKIFIDLFKSREHFEILIADNGDGFKLPT